MLINVYYKILKVSIIVEIGVCRKVERVKIEPTITPLLDDQKLRACRFYKSELNCNAFYASFSMIKIRVCNLVHRMYDDTVGEMYTVLHLLFDWAHGRQQTTIRTKVLTTLGYGGVNRFSST